MQGSGTLISQRPIDWRGVERFGFYSEGRQTSVPIRNVMLMRDWPVTLPADFFDNPAVTVVEPPSVAVRHAVHELIGDEFLSENVKQFRRQMAALPAAERFQRLLAGVLSGLVHAGVRLAGEFEQTDP